MPPSITRKPRVTATMATDSVAAISSTPADRKAIRRVAMVWVRLASSVPARPFSWPRARPNTCSVGSPATRSAKWLASRFCVRNRRATCSLVVQPIRIMNTGISGMVARMIRALGQSCRAIATIITTGTTAASTSCGRYLAK